MSNILYSLLFLWNSERGATRNKEFSGTVNVNSNELAVCVQCACVAVMIGERRRKQLPQPDMPSPIANHQLDEEHSAERFLPYK